MGEFTLILVGLIVLCLLASWIYAKKLSKTTQPFAPQTTDYAVTIWADHVSHVSPDPSDTTQPQRITVQYINQLSANSAEELTRAKYAFAQQCNADFQRRFIPMLGTYKIGAVHCQPANESE